MFKRLIGILLVAIMLFSLCSVAFLPVSAGEKDACVIVDDTTYNVVIGDIITYTVYLQADILIEDVLAEVNCDTDILSLIEKNPSKKAHCPNLSSAIVNTFDPGNIRFNSWSYPGDDFGVSKALFTADFEVISSGDACISLNVYEMHGYEEEYVAYFENGSPVIKDGISVTQKISAINGYKPYIPEGEEKIEISEEADVNKYSVSGRSVGYIGDTDDNDVVNIKDATAIQKYVAKMTPFTAKVKKLSDVDVNGVINIRDATAIQKYIAHIAVNTKIKHLLYISGVHEHKYDQHTVVTTCYPEGYTLLSCYCGDEERGNIISGTEAHSYNSSGKCTVCGATKPVTDKFDTLAEWIYSNGTSTGSAGAKRVMVYDSGASKTYLYYSPGDNKISLSKEYNNTKMRISLFFYENRSTCNFSFISSLSNADGQLTKSSCTRSYIDVSYSSFYNYGLGSDSSEKERINTVISQAVDSLYLGISRNDIPVTMAELGFTSY